MGKINLREAKQRQKHKQKESLVIQPNIIDPVLYATIERDYSEILKIIIEDASPILVSQMVYFIGKSESQSRRIIKNMIKLGLFGVNTWRGLAYLYPLKNAMAWYYKNPKERAMRSDHSDSFLFECFMRVERIIIRDKSGLDTLYLNNVESSIRSTLKGKRHQRYRIEEKTGDKPQYSTLEEFAEDLTKRKQFIENAIKRLRKDVYFRSFKVDKQNLSIQAYFVHHEGMKPRHYYRRLLSIYNFVDRFLDTDRIIEIEIIAESKIEKNNAIFYVEEGLKILKREREGGVDGEFKFIGNDLDFSRRYNSTEIYDDILTPEMKKKLDNFVAAIPK